MKLLHRIRLSWKQMLAGLRGVDLHMQGHLSREPEIQVYAELRKKANSPKVAVVVFGTPGPRAEVARRWPCVTGGLRVIDRGKVLDGADGHA